MGAVSDGEGSWAGDANPTKLGEVAMIGIQVRSKNKERVKKDRGQVTIKYDVRDMR